MITKKRRQSVFAVPLAARRVFFSCIQVRRFCRGGGTSSVRNVITAEKRSCFCTERLKVGTRRVKAMTNEESNMRYSQEKLREAIMRLTMCARRECEICKYKDRPKSELPSDYCKELSTKNMNILADFCLKD